MLQSDLLLTTVISQQSEMRFPPDNSWLEVECLPGSTQVAAVVYNSFIVLVVHGNLQVVRVRPIYRIIQFKHSLDTTL